MELQRQIDEARQLCGTLFRWLEEALLVNNPAVFYDRYPWLKGWVDGPHCGEGVSRATVQPPCPEAQAELDAIAEVEEVNE